MELKRFSHAPRIRRLFLEQLETRTLLAVDSNFRSLYDQFGTPPDERVSQDLWEYSQLILANRQYDLPRFGVPERQPDAPGHLAPQVSYDDQFRLRVSLAFLGVTPDVVSGLSALDFVEGSSATPPIGGTITDPTSWSIVEGWLAPADLDRMLQLDYLMYADIVRGAAFSVSDSPSAPAKAETPDPAVDWGRIDPKLRSAFAGEPNVRRPRILDTLGMARVEAGYYGEVQTDGTLEVDLTYRTNDGSVRKQLEEWGIRISAYHEEEGTGTARAWIKPVHLPLMSAYAQLQRVALPVPAVFSSGSWNTAGDGLLNAADVRARFAALGVNGSGIRVGVISDGVTHLSNAQAAFELPTVVTNNAIPGSGDEGTAMLEIIHDLAPGAELYFSSAFSGTDFKNAVDWMLLNTVNVIVDDVTFFDEPYFQFGSVAQKVANAISAGVTFVSAAGNDELKHYQAPAAINAGTGKHDFDVNAPSDDRLSFTIPGMAPGTTTPIPFSVYLQWSDEWGSSANNYNLTLYDGATVIDVSSVLQNGVGVDFPQEAVDGSNATYFTKTYSIEITGPAGVARELELFITHPNGLITESYRASSSADAIFGHKAAFGSIAVGAVSASNPTVIENFSSRGPSSLYSNTATQTKTLSNSLDVVGTDAVDTLASWSAWAPFKTAGKFSGTSAAAPHIAAIAALMRDAAGTATTFDFTGALGSTAVDLGSTGYDQTFGAGRANALPAVYRAYLPTTPPDLTAGSDTGVSSSDDITSSTSLTFTGVVPLGSFVQLFDNGVSVVGGNQQLGASVGNYSITVAATANVPHSYAIRVASASSSTHFSQFSPALPVHVQTGAPSATITAVSPDPRNAVVESFTITFNKFVQNFDVNDLILTRSGGANRFPGSAIISTQNDKVFTVSHIADITMAAGSYVLTLNYSGSGIQSKSDFASPVGANPVETWTQDNAFYQNGPRYYDVNDDTDVTSIDLLNVINALNAGYSGTLPGLNTPLRPNYLDTTADGMLTAIDALLLVNYLNTMPAYSYGPYLFRSPGEPTPPVSVEDIDAQVVLEVVDISGNTVTSITTGEQFTLRALLLLNAPSQVQPFAAYADVRFNQRNAAASLNPNDVGLLESTTSAGLIDEAGRLMYAFDGTASNLIFSKTFVASRTGILNFSAEAADLVGHEILVTGINEPLPLSRVRYGATSLTIKQGTK